jgi:hypothetical protein
MRHVFLVACGVILSVGPSLAQDSKEYTGEWLVENKSANIKIDNCGGSLWGVVSWEIKLRKSRSGAARTSDARNPDPDRPQARQGRAALGGTGLQCLERQDVLRQYPAAKSQYAQD